MSESLALELRAKASAVDDSFVSIRTGDLVDLAEWALQMKHERDRYGRWIVEHGAVRAKKLLDLEQGRQETPS